MDKAALVGADLQAGRQLIESLERLGITIDVAAWLQEDETGGWRLVLSSPALTRSGSKRVYDAVISILRSPHSMDLDDESVRVLSPNDSIVKDLRDRVRTNEDFQDIRLDSLQLGGQAFRSARIYRVTGGRVLESKLEHGARVRIRATGQFGTVHGVIRTARGPRYLVLYDVNPRDIQPLGEKPPPPAGQDYAPDDLEFVYVVRSAGWPEHIAPWLAEATGVTMYLSPPATSNGDRK